MSEKDVSSSALLEVRTDSGPFVRLGRQFGCEGRWCSGRVIASPVALYLLKEHVSDISNRVYVDPPPKGVDEGLSTCKVEDLPTPIRNQIDRSNKRRKKEVVIIPKSTVSFIRARMWDGTIRITVGEDHFPVENDLFRMFSQPRKLAQLGWILNTPLTPTAQPVHDMQSGSRPRSRKMTKKEAIVSLIATIVVVAVFIAAKTAAKLAASQFFR